MVAVGLIFFYFRSNHPSQNQNPTEEDSNEWDDKPTSRDESANILGYSAYIPPPPSPDISEEAAKKEVCKSLKLYYGNQVDISKVEKFLLDVNSKMDNNDRKLGQKLDYNLAKVNEKLAQKFLNRDVFLYLPKQTKFEQALFEAKTWAFFALWNAFLEHKPNGKIDWKESIKAIRKTRKKIEGGQSKNKAEQEYQKLRKQVEEESNLFFVAHAKKFPELTNLKELNQWVNQEAFRRNLTDCILLYRRALAANKIGKESWHGFGVPPSEKAAFENQKLGLTYKVNIYFVQDQK